MKVLIGAAAAVVLLAATAAAQTTTPPPPAASTATAIPSQCPALPPAPSFPDGATANGAAMDAANIIYTAWGTSMQAGITCRRNEYEAHLETARVRRDEHNVAADQLNSVTAAWQAETAEFCARPRQNCTPAEQ